MTIQDISRDLITYNATLLSGCRDKGEMWSINYYTVQPELFYHIEGKSIIAL